MEGLERPFGTAALRHMSNATLGRSEEHHAVNCEVSPQPADPRILHAAGQIRQGQRLYTVRLGAKP